MATTANKNPLFTDDNTNAPGRGWTFLRIVGWSMAAVLLLAPLVAGLFTDEVRWTLGDHMAAAILLGGTGVLFELALRRSRSEAFRWGALVALAGAFFLAWSNAAVGIMGSGANPANALYFAVLAIGLSGCWVAGVREQGMFVALFATAVAQALVTGFAVLFNWGPGEEHLPMVMGINAFFVALWCGAALLFRRSAERSALQAKGR